MGHGTCCVVNCKNTGRNNSNVKFYKFPTASHKLMQRRKWITAVRRVNSDGSLWSPKISDTICSEHFVNNAKAEEVLSPSYVPTIFPSIYKSKLVNQTAASNRHQRFMRRRTAKQTLLKKEISKKGAESTDFELVNIKMEIEPFEYQKTFCDQECEAFFFIESNESSKTFVCNRYMYRDASSVTCEVEIQTDIVEISNPVKICNRKKFKDAGCNTVHQKTFEDKMVGPNFETHESKTRHISGIDSVKEDE